MKRQVNVALDEERIKKIKLDAVELGVSLQGWMDAAADMFMRCPVGQRRSVAERIGKKLIGRPLCGSCGK